MSKNQQPFFTTRQLTFIALMTAVICVVAPFTIPIPGLVPISFANLILYLMCFILGTRNAFFSTLLFLLLGAVGLPVFSGAQGGLGKLTGPTGGYLIGYLFITLIGGIGVKLAKGKIYIQIAGLILGTAFCYILGTIWLALMQHTSFMAMLPVAVFPFLPGDFIKIILATVLGRLLVRSLSAAGISVNSDTDPAKA